MNGAIDKQMHITHEGDDNLLVTAAHRMLAPFVLDCDLRVL